MSHEQIQQYYGETLQSSADLQTDACCTVEAMPAHLKPILSRIHDEVLSRYYGCGLVAPEALAGLRVLDLGCGSGRDVYALSALVGEQGEVVGVDMTEAQLAVARAHQDYHAQAFGHARPNTRFLHGTLEALDQLPLEPNSFDLIVSNCVLNLCEDKAAVLRHAHRLLKPGGEFYFSDVYCDRRLPDALARDPLLRGECLGGALYWNDFLTLARQAGFLDPRLVKDRPLGITNPTLEAQLDGYRFYSATYRLFKLPELESACEDYGQAVRYRGTLPESPRQFLLDKHHRIEQGRIFPVCGNTWRMLADTRFAEHFDFYGDFSRHYGIFAGCGTSLPFEQGASAPDSAGCC